MAIDMVLAYQLAAQGRYRQDPNPDDLMSPAEGLIRKAESIPGGLAAGKKPEDFDQRQLKMGIKVELEHTPDKAKAREIAMDHLTEDPNYYDKLEGMESKLDKVERAILEFLKKHPKPEDEAIHALAKKLGINKHAFEERVYALLAKKAGVAEKSGVNELSDFAKGELTPAKARKILHDKEVNGHPLTDQQRKFFGAIASGQAPQRKSAKPAESPEEEERQEAEKEERDEGKPPPLPGMKKSEQPKNLDDWLALAGEEETMSKAKDDGKPGESLGETSTDELQATKKDLEARLKDKPGDAAMTARHKAIAAELSKRASKTDLTEKGCPYKKSGIDALDDFAKSEDPETESGEDVEPEPVEKSEVENMTGIEELAQFGQDEDMDMEKAQSMPEGNPKQKLGQGPEQGGKLAGVGKTSGDNNGKPGPGQDAKGQVTGTSTAKAKLSEDDEEDEAQMKEHKKPIETAKSVTPARQRDTTAKEHAQKVAELRKGEEDVVPRFGPGLPEPEQEPLEKATEGVQGMVHNSNQSDLEVERLLKSDEFYTGGSPSVIPFSRPIGSGNVCPQCKTLLSKSLTACPECGFGTVVHRVVPGGEAQGDHDGEPIVKSRAGMLRPRKPEKDIQFD